MSRAALGAGVLAGLLALTAGLYAGYRLLQTGATEDAGSTVLLSTEFADLNGQPVTLKRWAGQRLVVNFWATWCAPCREEMPLFNAMHAAHAADGVQFIGIAIDTPEAVTRFAQQLDIDYPLVVGGAAGLELVRRLGNAAGALPYTVLVEPDGRISRTRLGQIHEPELRQWLGQPGAARAQR